MNMTNQDRRHANKMSTMTIVVAGISAFIGFVMGVAFMVFLKYKHLMGL